MASVTSSPAAQQPKVTSHSAQASTVLVLDRTSTTSSPSSPRRAAARGGCEAVSSGRGTAALRPPR